MENIFFPESNAFGSTSPLTHYKCDSAFWEAETNKIDADAAVKKWFLVSYFDYVVINEIWLFI